MDILLSPTSHQDLKYLYYYRKFSYVFFKLSTHLPKGSHGLHFFLNRLANHRTSDKPNNIAYDILHIASFTQHTICDSL